ncbi:MAG: hypothetical protein IJO32_00495 [Bacilli bacterium]|nr:hypothetical protein [Bacilli bacterium]
MNDKDLKVKVKETSDYYFKEIKRKEKLIEILQAEIELTYEFINSIDRIGELVFREVK